MLKGNSGTGGGDMGGGKFDGTFGGDGSGGGKVSKSGGNDPTVS